MFISVIYLQINHLKPDKKQVHPPNHQAKSHLRSNHYSIISNDLYLWQTSNQLPTNPSLLPPPRIYTTQTTNHSRPPHIWLHRRHILRPQKAFRRGIDQTHPNPIPTPTQLRLNSDPTPSQLRPNSDSTPTQLRPNSDSTPTQLRLNSDPTPTQLRLNSDPTPT